jgi:hypothetical protein
MTMESTTYCGIFDGGQHTATTEDFRTLRAEGYDVSYSGTLDVYSVQYRDGLTGRIREIHYYPVR